MPVSVDAAGAAGYPVGMPRDLPEALPRAKDRPAERVAKMRPFLTMQLAERAFELQREGAEIAHLGLGEPDFPAPEAAIRACAEALLERPARYEESAGLPALRRAIAADLEQRFGAKVSADRVLVTPGTSPAMLLAFSLLLEPGDEVVYATPHYPCYPNFIRYCGGVPVPVPTAPENGWKLDPERVARVTGPKTRAIIVGSPANPTGAVQDRATLERLSELGVPLVSDEVYDGLVYDGCEATSALGLGDRHFVVDGFSKRYAMTGFRLGWLVVPEWAVAPARIALQNLFISANGFVQRAGVAALASGAESLAAMRVDFAKRRLRLVEGLRDLGFEVQRPPDGAFYVFAGARRFGGDSLALARALLERAFVNVAPGCDFGEAGEGYLRFSFAVRETTLETALERMARVLPELEVADAAGGSQ